MPFIFLCRFVLKVSVSIDSRVLVVPEATTSIAEASELAELLSQETCKMGEYELKLLRNEIVEYTYGRDRINTQKMQGVLQSQIPTQ